MIPEPESTPWPTLSRRTLLRSLGLAGAGLALGSSSARADARPDGEGSGRSAPQGAGYYKTAVGGQTVYVISDGTLGFAPYPTFGGNAPEAEVMEVVERAYIGDQVHPHTNLLLLPLGKNLILTDAGSGPDGWGQTGQLMKHLRHAGFEPGEVTHILISHAHPDHFWGVMDAEGRPAFPNAEILIDRVEYDHWYQPLSAISTDNAMLRQTSRAFDAVRKKLNFIEAGDRIVEGLTTEPLRGHTPGHIGIRFEHGGESLYLSNDAANHPVLHMEHPDWYFQFDVDPQQAVQTRRAILGHLAERRERTLAYHLPFPGLGHVAQLGDGGYRWYPENWQW